MVVFNILLMVFHAGLTNKEIEQFEQFYTVI